MVTEKIVDGFRVINLVPDMNEEERKQAEKEAVRNILREYNRLEKQERITDY
jgi:hypothetical protein